MKRIFSTREIVLGVTGSIAAYKACEIASRLVEYGASVTPVLTKSATELVGPATFEAITGHRAVIDMFEPLQNPEVEHIAVATRADLFLIAPATANILAKAAHGIADDWLSTTLLATRAPILFAPAMNTNMYTHPATQANIETLRERGGHFVGPDSGRLACGTTGPGRMSDPHVVIEAMLPLLCQRKDLVGKHILITSGGNREPIDPVRFIGNRSSGKMGRALALEALARGACVTVVSGPSETPLPHAAEVIRVETAAQMAEAVLARSADADAIIGAAAVADYRAANAAGQKRKRGTGPVTLELVENKDIIAAVGKTKRDGQFVVAFAAETTDLAENASAKLTKKEVDLVVANEVGAPDSGFGAETLRTVFIDAQGPSGTVELLTKETVAERLFDRVAQALNA
ncbi:MAG: bifunctional phosphopantothenoylcysteine decarboxylase/phosphopantothenate--cysteine ligase CoaBC [Nitrospiraceae bacterium]|nr:bifunctional phosphopantothenoylcysteine decarboxylase/phosphopantothenate--cysteine ligase CoaBC [Nitrospiraceae bacterium]